MSTSGLVPEFLGDLYVFYDMNQCLKYTSQAQSKCESFIVYAWYSFFQTMVFSPNFRILGNLCKNACKVSNARFSVSSHVAGNVSVTTDDKGIATVSMDKAPVNSLDTELIQAC